MLKVTKILVVDDDEAICDLAGLILRDLGGYEVSRVLSGTAALQAAVTDPPDLILLDAIMPDMDGPETLKRLQEDERTASIPVVFMTAKADLGDAATLRSMGAIGSIRKPFDPMSLPQSLGEILRAAPSSA